MNGEPITINANDEYYEAIKVYQDKIPLDQWYKDAFPIKITVAVQRKDVWPWMYAVIEEANNTDHNAQSYTIKSDKTGRLIMCNTKYICRTQITINQDLWEQIQKGTQCLENIFM